jgi:hypothetical protein
MKKKRCTKQSALNVERNVKFHSSLMAADLYTAESVTRREHQQEEDSRLNRQF